MKQFCITPVMGKRLIGMGMAQLSLITEVLKKGTLVIIAGSTNGYVAEEILSSIGESGDFDRKGFRRGLTVAPGSKIPKYEFPGDVVITDGVWQKGKTIFDVSSQLKAGDVILKGANGFDENRQAAVQIGHPEGGTIHEALKSVYGRRVTLIFPVGLEKRLFGDIIELAMVVNAADAAGPRLYPAPGEIFTEQDALESLYGVECTVIAAGGIYGAEGSIWVAVIGTEEQEAAVKELMQSINEEPACEV